MIRLAARSESRRTSPSHTRTTSHPAIRKVRLVRRSREALCLIFAIQYAALCPLASFARRLSMSRPCQKSPSTKIAILRDLITISGFYGSVVC